ESPAYGPLVTALRQVLTPLRIMQLRRLLDPACLQDASVLLPELVEQPAQTPAHAGLSGAQAQARLIEALGQVIAGLGHIAPHLLILEDLHWADPATLQALPALVTHLGPAQVLILLTVRPEESAARPIIKETLQALDRVGALDRLTLKRLNADHVAEFVKRALSGSPAGLAERLYQDTAGNPLFMVETLADWRENGILVSQASAGWTWRQTAQDRISGVPAGIRALIRQRLDRLPSPARQTAEAAAVIGTDVDFEVLDTLCALATPAFLDATGELVRRQVLIEQDTGYRFGHDQIRQVIYAQLPVARRRQLHSQVAQALQTRQPEPVELLAHHFWHAQDWDQATGYALAAGELARRVYAAETALAHYDRVIELGDQAGERFEQALCDRCEVWEFMGRYDRALQDSATLYEWGQKHDDARTMSQALDRSGWYHCLRGELDQGLADAQQARTQAERAGDSHLLAEALSTAGAIHGTRGDLDEALDLFHQALPLTQERDDPAKIARLWHNIGATHLLRGDNDAALAAFDEALVQRRALGDKRGVAWTLTNTGHIHYNQGHLDAAQTAFQEAQSIWQELNIRPDSLLTRIGLGAVQKSRGYLAVALCTFDEALAIAWECGDRQNEIMIQQNRGDILVAQGQYASARAALESALAHSRESGFSHQSAYTLVRLGHLYLALFAVPSARACLEEAEMILQGKGAKHDEAGVQRGLGLTWLALGDHEQAQSHLERAITWAAGSWVTRIGIANGLTAVDLAMGAPDKALARAAEMTDKAAALGYRKLAVEARQQQGEALLALDRATEAVAALQQALAIADEVGLPAVQWQTLAALGWAYRAQGQLPAARGALTRAASIIEGLAERIDDEALRAGFLAGSAVRQLYQAQAALGQPIHVRLARPDAPTGRPLNSDELVPVAWTVDAGETDAALLAAEGKVVLRRARIRRLLTEAAAQSGVPTERDLAEALGVTTRTIRSDLAALRQTGHDVRTRGT
ncbi:MAG: tetratricopeptide repeat protein, partial [Chloroflexi bacterium]|nr:tetratricopeptide repeat protein [Chloroflexota bacterium]